jgi:hypothetical protein
MLDGGCCMEYAAFVGFDIRGCLQYTSRAVALAVRIVEHIFISGSDLTIIYRHIGTLDCSESWNNRHPERD